MIEGNLIDYIGQIIPRGNIYTLVGGDWSTIKWDVNNPDDCPTEAEIIAKAEELRDADIYRKPRKKAYPSMVDQLDMLYWDKVNGTDNWQDVIAKVKSDNPKPE